jgi:putative transposase
MTKIRYSGYRFPPEIIQQAIWLYVRFTLSFRDVENLLAERGILVSYETVRRRVNHFGPMIAADLRKRRPKPHTIWHLDEVYLKIDGRLVYLWRAVDAEGEVLGPDQEEQAGGAQIDAQAAEEIWLCPRQARHR